MAARAAPSLCQHLARVLISTWPHQHYPYSGMHLAWLLNLNGSGYGFNPKQSDTGLKSYGAVKITATSGGELGFLGFVIMSNNSLAISRRVVNLYGALSVTNDIQALDMRADNHHTPGQTLAEERVSTCNCPRGAGPRQHGQLPIVQRR
jgi:hypothetical protein